MSTPKNAQPAVGSRLVAEAVGTFLLVFSIMGTGVFGAFFLVPEATPAGGVIPIAVALGLGVALIISVYAFGPISGGHFNPAVTIGLAAAGRFEWRNVGGYLVAQVVGGLLATTAAMAIGVFGPDGWLAAAQSSGFGSNGYGEHSPGGFGMVAAMITEVIVTAIFLWVIISVTHPDRPTPFAGLAIGSALFLLILIAIPVDNASINPARSLAAALYGGSDALMQLWVFIVFPIIGALLAGFTYKALFDNVER